MKLSIETYIPYVHFGDEEAIAMIKNAGFDCIDYSFYLKATEKTVGEDYIEHAQCVKKILDKNSMICNQAHAPFEMKYGDGFNMTEEKFVRIVRSIEAAAILGAEYIVVHAIRVPFGVDLLEYNESFYKSLLPYAKKAGIKIAIENLFSWDERCRCNRGLLHTPELIYEMLERLDSENFAFCLDVGHAALAGIKPQDMIRAFRDKTIKCLHISDNQYFYDEHWFPFHGAFEWNEIMSALKEIEYEGEFTFEVTGQFKRYEKELIPDALEFVAKIGRRLLSKI